MLAKKLAVSNLRPGGFMILCRVLQKGGVALMPLTMARPGETVFIPGGSGSFGQMAVPITRALGLNVIVSGNARARDSMMAAGATRYLDYRKENYW